VIGHLHLKNQIHLIRSKPAVLLSEIDDVVRMPELARRSTEAGDDFLKYSHKATFGDKIKAYITPKTEAYGSGLYHSAETEAIIPSGLGMRKTPLGFGKQPSVTAKDKWYDAWAKLTGYREYTVVPKYGIAVPIRPYTAFKLKDTGSRVGNILQQAKADAKFQKAVAKGTEGLRESYSNIIYKPLISPESAARVAAVSSASYIPKSKPYRSPSSYLSIYPSSSRPSPSRASSRPYPTEYSLGVYPSQPSPSRASSRPYPTEYSYRPPPSRPYQSPPPSRPYPLHPSETPSPFVPILLPSMGVLYIEKKKKKTRKKGARRRTHPVTLLDVQVLPKGAMNIV